MKSVTSIFLLTAIAAFSGCSQNGDGHTVRVPEGHPVYTISRKGALLSDENFDMLLVYGFNDNREISRQLTEFLNQSEPNTYFYFEKE